MKSKIPLAWLQLTREKTRLLVALGGIAFADILMFMQLGFKEALFDGNVRLHKNLEGDKASRKEFGPIADEFNHKNNVTVEVGGRRIRVGGIFELGASFGADGNVITSEQNFLRLFRNKNRNLGLIDIGLISLKTGANTKVVIEKLRNILPEDVKLMTKQEYIELESYWQNSTSIGFIFNLGTIIGFLVGTVIVYQILYNEVSDHLPEYATLQAMGYTHTYLLSVVFH